jgi:energy-coupling factor transport system ATP-binding protein
MLFELCDVSAEYRGKRGERYKALTNLHLTIDAGDRVGIAGPEGSGKSTLLKILGLLLEPVSGTVMSDGRDVWSDREARDRTRRRSGFLFQFPEQYFLGTTVEDELCTGLRHENPETARLSILSACTTMGLAPGTYLGRSPFLLSLGEARRVALASLLVRSPAVLLLDEPTAGLDGHAMTSLSRFLQQAAHRQATLIVVSHDLDFLATTVSRLVILQDGRVAVDKPLAEVIHDEALLAAHEYEIPDVVRLRRFLESRGVHPASLEPEELRDLARGLT